MSGEALRSLIASLPPERLDQVLTHSSWAVDRASSYERLEFLGLPKGALGMLARLAMPRRVTLELGDR